MIMKRLPAQPALILALLCIGGIRSAYGQCCGAGEPKPGAGILCGGMVGAQWAIPPNLTMAELNAFCIKKGKEMAAIPGPHPTVGFMCPGNETPMNSSAFDPKSKGNDNFAHCTITRGNRPGSCDACSHRVLLASTFPCEVKIDGVVVKTLAAADRDACYKLIGFGSENCKTYAQYLKPPPSKSFLEQYFNKTDRLSSEYCGAASKGLTWRLISTNAPTGTIRVGCGISTGQNECNPYQGDTACTTALPLLCIKKVGTGFPLPPPASVDNTSQNNKWSGAVVGTTSATVPPKTLAGLDGANAMCEKQFGMDWRVAEFHDGAAWYFQAYGGVGDPTKRFWIHINDQPGGTCWR